MKYKYIYGPSGSGKTKRIMSDLLQMAATSPEKNFYLIVPDQYTMQAQKDMVWMSPVGGILNIDVLSFGRLAYKIFEEVGVKETIVLDDTGKNLLLRRISLDIEHELESLGRRLQMPGFIHEVKSVISEFMQYGVGPEKVDELINYAKNNNKKALYSRLSDIRKIYDAFIKAKQDRYTTTEEGMTVLASLIPRASSLKDSVVVFDGFTGFTPVQNSVLTSLLGVTDELWFSLTIDDDSLNSESHEGELFALTKKTINSLNRLMSESKATHIEDIHMQSVGIRYNCDELRSLERRLFRKNAPVICSKNKDIKLTLARDPRAELKSVCIEINRLVREENYAYRDIAIVTGGLEEYSPIADEIFGRYEIPVFVDTNRRLELNPFIEYVKGGLKVIESNYSYESVMHFLRTYMTDISREDIDEFDNYITALKLRGASNYEKTFVRKPRFLLAYSEGEYVDTSVTLARLEAINDTRQKLMDLLNPLASYRLGEHAVKDITASLYKFIADNDCFSRLQILSALFEENGENGDLARKKEYDQVYEAVMKLLEQLHSLLGDDKVTLTEYIKLLEAGISEIKIGVLPQEIDYCVLGDIERTRLKEIKALFFVGVNDGIIPKTGAGGGIISDLDREFLSGLDIELSPSPRQKMFTQRLYLYMNMTKPSNKLFISYSAVNLAGKSLRPAYLIQTIKKLYEEPKEIVFNESKIYDNIASKKDADSYLAELIRRYAEDALNTTEDRSLFYSLYEDAKCNRPDAAKNLARSAFFEYKSSPLSRELVHALYGQTLVNSVSRLEKYASCAYAHFLQYGMGLKLREDYSVTRPDLGNIYHKVLESYAAYLKDNGLDWNSISDEDASKVLDGIFDSVTRSYGEGILFQDARNIYQLEKMKRILHRTIKTLAFQIGKTSFRPQYFEMGFKKVISDKDFKVGLDEEERMRIQGRIDRVDTYSDGDALYVKVVDYKSGENKLNLVELYNGLSLQLVIYLQQAVNKLQTKNPDKEVKPAAMYYYHVQDPFMESEEDIDSSAVNEWVQSQLKLTGLSLDEANLIEKLGGELINNKSEVINVSKVQKGDYSKNSEIINSSDLNTVMNFAEKKVLALGKEIIEGNIEATPCREQSCTYCDFKEICGYDSHIDGYKDYSFENIDKADAITAMREAIEADQQE